jgi:hypothetical protein
LERLAFSKVPEIIERSILTIGHFNADPVALKCANKISQPGRALDFLPPWIRQRELHSWSFPKASFWEKQLLYRHK